MHLVMRHERIQNGWTQEHVAKQVNATKATIQRIETGQRHPSYPVLVKLEDLFGKSHRELFAPAPEEPPTISSE